MYYLDKNWQSYSQNYKILYKTVDVLEYFYKYINYQRNLTFLDSFKS